MCTILVVEDETSIAMSLSAVLSEAGFSVHSAREARHAIAAADSFAFDAAIVARGLPDPSGGQIAEELRARDSELPIFVCTALDEESVARWAVQERMIVLEEPVDEVQLVWLLEAHVGSRS